MTDRTAQVYLTDTLESPNVLPDFPAAMLLGSLNEERRRAQRVKKDVSVLVCLGNPPYDREQHEPNDAIPASRRKGGWVRRGDEGDSKPPPILEDFLKPVRDAGGGVHLKNLYNDYVYFWRWGLWKVFDSTNGPGVITFITASSYLRGPGFAGMRRKMREVLDDLWIIDLEGDNLGARKTEGVFAIRTPVAIAVGVRYGAPDPVHPARVWKTKLTGSEAEKLAALEGIQGFDSVLWRACSNHWDAPFYPTEAGSFATWPAVTDVFPWQHTGVEMKRSWPIAELPGLLSRRWRDLLGLRTSEDGKSPRADAFRETRDRLVSRTYPSIPDPTTRLPAIASLSAGSEIPVPARYAFRTLDRQWVLPDARVGDFLRPTLWRSHGPSQTYLTSFLTEVAGLGPAAVASSDVPDRHIFRGSFGGKHVIPLWRDADATQPNVTGGLLDRLAAAHGRTVSPEDLFAYAYGVLAQPSYVEKFWDELELPPPRLPITKDADLFGRVADHGRRLLYLHTYGERFRGPRDDGSVPRGAARCTKGVPPDEYPEGHRYDPVAQTLHVGQGEFAPVSPEVYGYSVSGLQVVKSWLDYRKKDRAGRSSSPLDDIRPERWEFEGELLELLWVVEHTIALQPEGAALLDEVCASDVFSDLELPTPTDAERQPPGAVHSGPAVQGGFALD